MKVLGFEISETFIEGDDLLVNISQPNSYRDDEDCVTLTVDQLPMVIAELQRLYDERDGI